MRHSVSTITTLFFLTISIPFIQCWSSSYIIKNIQRSASETFLLQQPYLNVSIGRLHSSARTKSAIHSSSSTSNHGKSLSDSHDMSESDVTATRRSWIERGISIGSAITVLLFHTPSLVMAELETPSSSPSSPKEEDPLDAFGKSLQENTFSSSFPLTPSPLPTNSKTALELTLQAVDKKTNNSSLENAINEAKKRKQVNPLTHG